KEYFGAIDTKKLNSKVITPVFKENKDGKVKIVSFFAKKARGMMSRYIIDNKISNPKDLLKFDVDGYKYDSSLSTELEPVFVR
ncbi:MAG: peroxide stress protein YaaA, partial [Bacteriovoracaceae bacterium]|nr:peroxide stress protein YaaA [Bacteriovoracaceae bacterium]